MIWLFIFVIINTLKRGAFADAWYHRFFPLTMVHCSFTFGAFLFWRFTGWLLYNRRDYRLLFGFFNWFLDIILLLSRIFSALLSRTLEFISRFSSTMPQFTYWFKLILMKLKLWNHCDSTFGRRLLNLALSQISAVFTMNWLSFRSFFFAFLCSTFRWRWIPFTF